MNTIQQIKEVELQIQNITKFLKENTLNNNQLVNGIRIGVLEKDADGDIQIISNYWFGYNSEIDYEIIQLYKKGLENSLKHLIIKLQKESEEIVELLNKYK